MGTALVPFKTWGDFTAARKNMQVKARLVGVRFTGAFLVAGAAIVVLLLLLYALSTQLMLLGVAILAAIFVYERLIGPRGIRRNQIANLPNVAAEFPCPHCNENYNLGWSWICGWCKEIHNDWFPFGADIATPITSCTNQVCEPTRLHALSGGQGDQAALQCLHCHRHIVLDPVLYESRQCHLSPYNGVARFVGDTAEPNQPMPIRSVYPAPPGEPDRKPDRSSSRRRNRLDDEL